MLSVSLIVPIVQTVPSIPITDLRISRWSSNRVVAVFTARKDPKRLSAQVRGIREEERRNSELSRRQIKEEQYLNRERNRLERERRRIEEEKLDIQREIAEKLQQLKAESDPAKPSFWST